jgi:hypothetical protein
MRQHLTILALPSLLALPLRAGPNDSLAWPVVFPYIQYD